MTVPEAFQRFLAAVMTWAVVADNKKRLADAAEIDESYLGRLINGQMSNPTLAQVEKIRVGLSKLTVSNLHPAALFSPENFEGGTTPVQPAVRDRLAEPLGDAREEQNVRLDPYMQALQAVWDDLPDAFRSQVMNLGVELAGKAQASDQASKTIGER